MSKGRLLSAADVTNCPHRVALDRGADRDVEEKEPTTEVRRRIHAGASHRERTLAALQERYPDAVVTDDYEPTAKAMDAGVRLILRARLADTSATARRLMSVEALVRTSAPDAPRQYAPIVVKNNEAVGPAATRRMLRGSLDELDPRRAEWVGGVGARRNEPMFRNSALLAHATRVLDAFGVGDDNGYAGLIDRHGRLWWFPLRDPDTSWRLADYDEAHRQRLEILLAHDRWRRNEGPFPTEPFWHRECPTCPYVDRCRRELERDDDVSLVRFTSRAQQVLLREHGISTRLDLARLDPAVAAVARDLILVRGVDHEPEVHLGAEIDRLDELIYRARSAVRGTPLRKNSLETLHCPTADVEIDVDMESYNDATYLWGAYVTTRRPVPGVTEGYRSFVCWEPLDEQREGQLFTEFWTWFMDQRRAALEAGATFRAYCFWAQAEDHAMDRAVSFESTASPSPEEVIAFRAREPREWVDLHDVVRAQIQTDGLLGLKSLAKAAGFSWRDENPSGEASMTWYEEAVGPEGRAASRTRLLEYNEDDCRATRALREWLNGPAKDLPSRDDRP